MIRNSIAKRACICCCLFTTFFITSDTQAQLKLSGIFADHMVMQQKVEVPVWGMADPNKKITVTFAGQKKETVSDEKGKWKLSLAAMDASAKPATLVAFDGSSSVKVEDVLIGEVWLCTGQSNMGVSLGEVDDADKVIAEANDPLMRIFKVAQTPAYNPRNDVSSRWIPCSPAVARPYSAMGYFMAKLRQELNVPVGMVVSAWGGSSVLAWLSEEALNKSPLRQNIPRDLIGFFENHRPTLIYNGMVHPLVPYAVKGVVWYQGESDAMDDRFNPYLYRTALGAMISDWRNAWKRADMPFYLVQLPNLSGGKLWPVLRESQDIVNHGLKNTGMITTIDIGQTRKLHPTNKVQFANRMADLILSEQYNKSTASKYPSFQSMSIEKNKINLSFKDAEGLKTNTASEPLAFEIAGSDQVFKPAAASVEGSHVIVSNKDIPQPVAVRYAFAPDPKVNLVNKDGLPARPFRTDTWPVTGMDAMAAPIPVKQNLELDFSLQNMVSGTDKDWSWSVNGKLNDRLEDKTLQIVGKDKMKIQVVSRRNTKAEESSPAIGWKKQIAASGNGITFEIDAQIARASLPYSGFAMHAGILSDNKLNVYKIDITLLRIMASREAFIYVLANDVDNTDFYKYRLAIRKDGICQVYFNEQLIGVVKPEVIEDQNIISKGSYISFGKLKNEGDIVLNIASVSFDNTGAYSPSENANKF